MYIANSQPDTKSYPDPNVTTKWHEVVSIQRNSHMKFREIHTTQIGVVGTEVPQWGPGSKPR